MLQHRFPFAICAALTLSLGACDQEEDFDEGATTTPATAQDDVVDNDDEAEDEPEGPSSEEPEPEPEPEGPELCESNGERRECITDEDAQVGVQFCDVLNPGEALSWGPCLAWIECEPGTSTPCGGDEENGGGGSEYCALWGGVPQTDGGCDTPLALSFDRAPIEMVASPASFDISGAGECLSTDWPAARNPWLAIDLDKSGSIDGGHELFGSGSVLATGRHATNGFLALSEYDSNADGAITAEDERFEDILVWRDGDSDKRSAGSELTTLSEEGVTQISLGYELRQTCDARGNCGRERSSFEFTAAGGKSSVGEVVDIYLPCW